MGPFEIDAFLNHLAVERQVSASTQNQAFAALLYLYQQVLNIDLPRIDSLRAKRPDRLPVVLSIGEVRAILDRMQGRERLMVELLYGTSMRLLECCRLRVKDVDFSRNQILIRDGKGEKDRDVPLPQRIKEALHRQVELVRVLQDKAPDCSAASFAAASLRSSSWTSGSRSRGVTTSPSPGGTSLVAVGTSSPRRACPGRCTRRSADRGLRGCVVARRAGER